ncbi:hypothetical protein KL938_000829 [Ogataea parapolymorpha]|nr:hypothetical protein KL938_000829 [Ogataea parapolymorpha]
MNFPPNDIKILVEEIAELLLARKQTLSVSEGACGGLLSAYLISLPGASKFFDGGRLVYSLKSRLKLSGWNTDQIRDYTGPSEAVVLRLARNLRIEFGSTYVLSESGFAGPSTSVGLGDQESITDSSKQGVVYLGISGPYGDRSCTVSTGSEDRSENMQLFAKKGLEFLLRVLRTEG